MLLLTTRESEAVPEQRRACALTTAQSALRSAAQGTPDISLDRSCTGGHALPPSPSAARSRNNKPLEKLRRGQPAVGEPWMKEYHIYRTDSSWSTQISWGKSFAFSELAQKYQLNCCGNLVIYLESLTLGWITLLSTCASRKEELNERTVVRYAHWLYYSVL